MNSQHALFITQCNVGFLATTALVTLLLWNCVTSLDSHSDMSEKQASGTSVKLRGVRITHVL